MMVWCRCTAACLSFYGKIAGDRQIGSKGILKKVLPLAFFIRIHEASKVQFGRAWRSR